MDMNKKEMIELLEKIAPELEKTGKTDVKCPICNTKITEDKIGKSSVIHCHTENCLVFTLRGI